MDISFSARNTGEKEAYKMPRKFTLKSILKPSNHGSGMDCSSSRRSIGCSLSSRLSNSTSDRSVCDHVRRPMNEETFQEEAVPDTHRRYSSHKRNSSTKPPSVSFPELLDNSTRWLSTHSEPFQCESTPQEEMNCQGASAPRKPERRASAQ